MKKKSSPISRRTLLSTGVAAAVSSKIAIAGTQTEQEKQEVKRAFVDGMAPGFEALGEEHFTRVNSNDDTWTFKDNVIECTGRPVSVIRTKKQYTNFELVVQWMHHKPAGNSGIFVWTTPASIERLTKAGKPGLPQGIEVQVLDLAYGQPNPANWYTSHGDVFPVGV
ncbi:MAG: family 16 glycoside hydrolase, partial [Mariniblastus sp.]